ncbi:MAG: TonB-dependent receptor plug domain-containing protein [Gammaproteobacteria bacterium]|nr:TonB-dependent receptor plug domain-containing protein [Gammaproteobacteria bacterium]
MVTRPLQAARRVSSGVFALVAFLTPAQGAAGLQDTGSVMGLVLDQEGLEPVSDALVALPEFIHHRTRTDADGWFRLLNVPAGEVVVRVEGDGFSTLVETVEIAPMEESLIHFHVHRVSVVLDQLLVEVPRVDDRGRGHSEARVTGTGARSRTAADLLLTGVPGVAAQQPQGGVGTGVRIRLRGVNSFLLSEEPQIFLDGVRIDAGGQDRAMLTLEQIPATSVTRIRVLRGPASTSRYPGAAAGVILVETMNRGG